MNKQVRAPEINEMAVELVCWLGWANSPATGLARWQTGVYWFAQFNTWVDGDTWGYDFNLYELSAPALSDAVAWFKEKEQWFFNPELVALRQVTDEKVRARLIEERGLTLRDWKGPALPDKPVAWFRHRENPSFHGGDISGERWRLPPNCPTEHAV